MYTTNKAYSKYIFIALFACMFAACKSESSKQPEVKEVKLENTDSELKGKIESTLAGFPSPVDIVTHITQADLGYQKDVLNPVANAQNYTATDTKTALNLGAYMADMGYTCAYFNVQEGINYLKTTKELSKELDILNAYENSLASRFENNLKDRDSLLEIVKEGFYSTHNYLKENDRPQVAALLVTGCWVEGLYIATQSAKNFSAKPSNESVRKEQLAVKAQIGYQKKTVANLVDMLKQLNSQDQEVKKMVSELESLKTSYEKVLIKNLAPSESIEDASTMSGDLGQVAEVGTLSIADRVSISEPVLKDITTQIAKIRGLVTAK